MASQSSSCCSQTNPCLFLSLDKRLKMELDNLRYLAPASLLIPSPSPLLPVDSNLIVPSDYPAHSSPMDTMRDTRLSCVLLPNKQESIPRPLVQPTRGAGMPDSYSATEQIVETNFLEDFFSKQTNDSDCSPPFECLDVLEDVNFSNKHVPFSYFPEKPEMPNAKFQPLIISEDMFWDDSIWDDPPNHRLCSTPVLKPQDVEEMEPLSITTIDPITPLILDAPVNKPPLDATRKTTKPNFRSDCSMKNIYNSNKGTKEKNEIKKMNSPETEKEPFCVKSLATKFIHAAKQKLSNFNAQEKLAKERDHVFPNQERIAQRSREITASLQAKKRVIKTNVSQSPRKLKKLAANVMPVNVGLPQHNSPVRLVKSKIEDCRSRVKSKVDIDVSHEGNLFVTIHLTAPSPSITSNQLQALKKVNYKKKRISNYCGRSRKTPYDPLLSNKKKTKNPFVVQSLTAKFIKAAKNKSLDP